MECKQILNGLKLKGYFVTKSSLNPINHREVIKITDMGKQVIVVKLEDIKERIKPPTEEERK